MIDLIIFMLSAFIFFVLIVISGYIIGTILERDI